MVIRHNTKKPKMTKILALLSIILVSSSLLSAFNKQRAELFLQLESSFQNADTYIRAKEEKISDIKTKLTFKGLTLIQQYNIHIELFKEYESYSYPLAVECLDRAESIARSLGNQYLLNNVLLKKALINTTVGMYLEARITIGKLTPEVFTDQQYLDYWYMLQKFSYDYVEYTPDNSQKSYFTSEYIKTRDKILEKTNPEDKLHQEILIRKYIDSAQYEKADSLSRSVINKLDNNSHEYAYYAYYQAFISKALGNQEEADCWLIRSSIADIRCAVKENASLLQLALSLYEQGDIERSYRYSMLSLADAKFFNAKFRQWQISEVLPNIQTAYSNVKTQHEKTTQTLIYCLIIFIAFAICVAIYSMRNGKKLKRKNDTILDMNNQIRNSANLLKEINEQMLSQNAALHEANKAKEEYIRLSLSTNSQYFDKLKAYQNYIRKCVNQGNEKTLKELLAGNYFDKELKNFYQSFDLSFIKLYPKFVDQFNALLKPEARIAVKSDEILNAELRIFALIKLGITQSSQIAQLLRYSVNTIYNYRAQIKNQALINRDDFEHQITLLGN